MSESIWKDLLAWQKDIDAKDKALSRRKPVHEKVNFDTTRSHYKTN